MMTYIAHLVALDEAFPSLDESFSDGVLQLSRCIAVVVENVGDILVDIRNESPQLGAQKLIEELFYSSLYTTLFVFG